MPRLEIRVVLTLALSRWSTTVIYCAMLILKDWVILESLSLKVIQCSEVWAV